MHDELAAAFETWIADVCPPDAVRAIDGGGSPAALWSQIESSGYLDALVPESHGGAGLALAAVQPLVRACGAHAVPVPLAETMVARAELARAGRSVADGPLALAALDDATLPAAERATWVAAITSALIAGAAQRVLELTTAYAQQRVQFGRPIGSFQAIQHRLAVMAEQTCAARMAAQLAFAAPAPRPDRTLAAIAKCVAGEAAAVVAAGGHAVHGAIGITAAYDLQLSTRRLLAWRTQGGSPTYWAREVGAAWWRSGATRALDFALARLDVAQGANAREDDDGSLPADRS
jgi:alkylation response protein AidB-like acyl-CoA dehydrogenase